MKPTFAEPLLFVPIEVYSKKKLITTYALLDSGASGNFISKEFVKSNQLSSITLAEAIPVSQADGSKSKAINSYVLDMPMKINEHSECLTALVIDTPHPIILGLVWLKEHNPNIDFKNKTLTFDRCPSICSSKSQSIKFGRSSIKTISFCSSPFFFSLRRSGILC